MPHVEDPLFDPIALFQRSVRSTPHGAALRINGSTITYAELDMHSRRVAAWCDMHCPRGARVAVHGRKTVLAYAGVLGILRSGRSYVPLHPEHPPLRWQTMLARAGVTCAVAPSDVLPKLSEAGIMRSFTEQDIPTHSASEVDRIGAEAYVMFTSGSTGEPKGVAVGRPQVAAYLRHVTLTYPCTSADRFTQFFALSFDLSVHDLFVCWAAGACLCIPPDDAPLRTAEFARSEGITVWFSVPSLVEVMHRMRSLKQGAMPTLRLAFFCGEALRTDIARQWALAAPKAATHNFYGPTEATIAITAQRITPELLDKDDPWLPLGIAFPGHQIRVMREDGWYDTGEGELLLHGPQVNTGYLGDEQATRAAFLRSPEGFGPWYRTGDRVRIEEDGSIYYMGRTDDQVKLAGHRVEPGEVDAVLQPLIPDGTAVTVPVEMEGTLRLITFIDAPADTEVLFTALRSRLPRAMLPERIITLVAFPYGAHGKLDRKALKEMATHG